MVQSSFTKKTRVEKRVKQNTDDKNTGKYAGTETKAERKRIE